MNGKIKRGEMSLDDSSAFLGMTVKIPVGTGQGAPIALDDWERVNFVQLAADALGALHRRRQAGRLAGLQFGQIGRASCRDRVWPYGVISGGAVSLKKKQK